MWISTPDRGAKRTPGDCGLLCHSLGIKLVELPADLITDGFDQRGGSELAPDMIDVQDQHHDADDHQDEGDDDRHARDELGALGGAHLAQRQHRVRKCPDEDADRELAGLVLQNAGDDAGGELTHCELDHHQDHRQHQSGEAHHRARDRAEDFQCRSGPPVSARGIKAPSKARSTATLITDSAIPAPMQTSGQNHMLVRSQ